MAESTIEWTEKTWNPTTGCDRISAGCDNCYALTLAKRLKGMELGRITKGVLDAADAKYQTDGDPRTSGPGFGLALHPSALDVPRTWTKPTTVFVNSMSDLFHARVPLSFVRDVFDVIRETPRHTYQVLTKRAIRLRRLAHQLDWPDNLWMGVSVENAEQAHRVDQLRDVPARVRFLSCEPLLGSLRYPFTGDPLDMSGIHWLIAGGESGPNSRPVDAAWVRELRDWSVAAGTSFFFKQWGGRTPKANGRELDGRTWDEYPRVGEVDRG